MNYTVNGDSRVSNAFTIYELIAAEFPDQDEPGDGIAVALNGEVVPRSLWSQTDINEGDAVEILTAVQGG